MKSYTVRVPDRALALLTALAVLTALMVVFAPAARAHHPILGVEAECTDENIYVTWSLANGDWEGGVMVVREVSYTDGLTDFENIKAGLELAVDASTSDTLVYPQSESGVKTLRVKADWESSNETAARELSIDLEGVDRTECTPATTTTTEATTTTTEATTTTTEATTTTTIPDEVSPTSIVNTTTTIVSTTAPEVSPETLPFTGAESGTPAALALLLIAGGALALVGASGFRTDKNE